MTVRTRFAPSPTGYLHIGGVRTALYSWLFAKQQSGQFILRIEDTDELRSTQEAEDVILQGMQWLGLSLDVGPLRQTERKKCYTEKLEYLLNTGRAYYCDCSNQRLDEVRQQQKQRGEKMRYDNCCRNANKPKTVNSVARLKTPSTGEVSFIDEVYGEVRVSNTELDDLILCRSNGMPTYNFAVVVDDLDCQVTHVIRGDDHINNTFRQLHIYQALGEQVPVFAHSPMVLGEDGTKLSKRHGAVSVLEYQQRGYLPQALLNYLLRLGWSHGNQEIFSLSEMIELFNFSAMNKAPPRFDAKKLDWINQQYIQMLPVEDLLPKIDWHLQQQNLSLAENQLLELLDLYKDRSVTIVDFIDQIRFVFDGQFVINDEDKAKHIEPNRALLQALYECLQNITAWQATNIMATIKDFVKQHHVKIFQVGMPLRLALTGRSDTPDFSKIAKILGKKVVAERLKRIL